MKENVGNWTVVPCGGRRLDVVRLRGVVRRRLVAFGRGVASWSSSRPVKVNVLTSPIWLKNGTTVSRTNRRSCETTACTREERAFGEDDDHRLLGGGEVADDRDHADHERALRRVGDERLLAVEQRHLGGLQDVGAPVALGGVDEEEGFDVAEDGEARAMAPAAASNPPNCGTASPKLPCVNGMSRSAAKMPGADMPTVTLRPWSTSLVSRAGSVVSCVVIIVVAGGLDRACRRPGTADRCCRRCRSRSRRRSARRSCR